VAGGAALETLSSVERKQKRRATVDQDYDAGGGVVEAKSFCLSPTVGPSSNELKKLNKKKGFSWRDYLSEENAKVAAPKLFKNVRD